MTVPGQNGHIEHEELTLYALQLLTPDEAAVITEHLRRCAECRAEVAAAQGDLAAYALSAEVQSPAAAAKQRLMKQIARERKVIPMAPPVAVASVRRGEAAAESSGGTHAEVHRGSGRARDTDSDLDSEDEKEPASVGAKLLPWLGWAVAAGVSVAALNLYHEGEQMRSAMLADKVQIDSLAVEAARGQALVDTLTDKGAMRVTLTQSTERAKPQGRATYLPEKGSLVFLANNLEPLAPYKTYELWLIPADGRDPIPAGTFQPDTQGNASVLMPSLPKGVAAKAFGVTIEDEGGSKQPTMPIVLAGA
jgi:anti-sigma-K factor RskA